MFTENIYTPHPRSPAYTGARQALLEVVQPARLHETIAQAGEASDTVRLAAAEHIQTHVHDALWFKLGNYPAYQPANGEAENIIPENQETNCLGYVAITAEILALAGIQNHIIYFKDHFMNGVVTGENTSKPQLHMFDAINPSLSQNLTNTLRGVTVARLLQQQAVSGRGAARIDTERLLTNAGYIADEFTHRPDTIGFTWLYYQKGDSLRLDATSRFARDERWERRNRYTSFMSIYPHGIGMRVLAAYGTFKAAIGNKNYEDALASSYKIAGLFPELDARLKHDKIKALVLALTASGHTEDALAATFNYCTSFACSSDPRLKGIEAGLYYDIAIATGDVEVAALGLHAYQQALGDYTNRTKKPIRSETFEGKMAKLQKIIQAGR
ncbi:MAG TPA: hypothetical protein VLG16_02720 [Candidatus Saccharimonadales bacterium]|nr:hypothetical protein [Candidatus Saccharimonadales bacterium]